MPSSAENTAILVIGIGNEYASDDAAGLLVARRLKQAGRADFAIREESGEGAALIEAWKSAARVIVIDAVRSGGDPGGLHRLDASGAPLPAESFRGSTHAFGLYEAVELARSLGDLPQRMIVFGVEGQNFAAGRSVSPAVEHAIDSVARAVLEEIKKLGNEQVEKCMSSH
ncbi:MAG TPA: hydrogenase maturation protease [Terriglobales bacterium]